MIQASKFLLLVVLFTFNLSTAEAQPPCYNLQSGVNTETLNQLRILGFDVPARFCVLEAKIDFPSFSIRGEVVLKFGHHDQHRFKAHRHLAGEDIYEVNATVSKFSQSSGHCGGTFHGIESETTFRAWAAEFGTDIDYGEFVIHYYTSSTDCSKNPDPIATLIYRQPRK